MKYKQRLLILTSWKLIIMIRSFFWPIRIHDFKSKWSKKGTTKKILKIHLGFLWKVHMNLIFDYHCLNHLRSPSTFRLLCIYIYMYWMWIYSDFMFMKSTAFTLVFLWNWLNYYLNDSKSHFYISRIFQQS